MKPAQVIIFFTVFFTIYGLTNYYILLRGWQAFPATSQWRSTYVIVFLVLAFSFIAGRILERIWISPLSDVLVWTGSFWIGAMLYFFLAAVLLDILRLLNFLVPVYPSWVRENYGIAKQRAAIASCIAVFTILIAGHINALIPRLKILSFTIAKRTDDLKSLTIVVASDIHLGTMVGRNRLDRYVEKINALNADLVLLPGDIVDEDLAPVIRENFGESLRNIRARYGVVAITGNHEYIGGAEAACRYLTQHGIRVLRDEVMRLDGGVVLVGREDRSISQFAGKRRKALGDLLAGIDRSYPIILLDHQPFHLEEGANSGVDLQLSGHTHHGQLWPVNFITRAIYQVSQGYVRIGQTHVYVSNGAGTWGPPVRTSTRPEIVHITLTFQPYG